MTSIFRKAVVGAALVGSTIAGGALGAALLNGSAGAQTTTTEQPSDTTPSQQAPDKGQQPPANGGQLDPTKGGHVGANGVKEELLTGDAAAQVTAAANAAVPGGTIQRVETDAEGAAYEAHMTDASGAQVTVKLDSSFNVTSVENGAR